MTNEQKKRMSEAAKRRWARYTPEERKEIVKKQCKLTFEGQHHTFEARKAIKKARAKQHQIFNEKAKEHMSISAKKYWASLSFEERNKKIQRFIQAPHSYNKDTSIELEVERQLKELGIEYQKQKKCYNKRLKKTFIIDFYIPNYNNHEIFIECNGEYWHSLPKRKLRDKMLVDGVNNQVKSKKHKNLTLIVLWGKDIKTNPNIVKEKLNLII